jgi:hypothetical protein
MTDVEPDDLPALVAAGVTQLVLVESPPEDPTDAGEWTRALAEPWRRSRDRVR